MVSCPKCVINNTLDSAFCKKCGAILPVSMIEEEQEKLKEIVAKGMESFQSGNLDEAMAVADHSILTNPSYSEAYALKGLVHERKGAYAEALDAYETVVTLNPDSTMDKIKLNQLRNAFATRQAGDPKMDRKGAALTAVGVAFACMAFGGVVYGVTQNSKETKPGLANNSPAQQTNSNLLANRSNAPQQPITNNPTKQNPSPGDIGALGSDNSPEIDSRPRTTPINRNHSSSSNFGDGETEVVTPRDTTGPRGPINHKPGNSLPRGDGVQPENKTVDPAATPKNDRPDEKGIDPPTKPENGTMEVSISHRGSDTNTGSKGSEGNSGKAYQRQGQAHQRSGKTAQAREAYQKAIDAYQKDIDSGKGDKDSASAGLNSSKQALKNLKD